MAKKKEASDDKWLLLEPRLAVKVGSLIVHAQEMLSPGGHEFDRVALMDRLNDPEVLEWLKSFPPAMLPVKR